MGDTAVAWSDRFMHYRWVSTHPMNPIRLALTISLAESLDVLGDVRLHNPEPADDALLRSIHTEDYLMAVRAASRAEGVTAGSSKLLERVYGLGNADNPIFAGMHDAGALLVGATVQAAELVATGQARRAVNISGGMHHAMAGHAAGFCIYNDCAIAITWLLDHGYDRIAYVDIDAHHGDGVQQAFIDDPRVLTVSVHEDPASLWPGTGYADEVGSGAAAGTAVNIPLPPGTPDALWLRAFHAVVPGVVGAFKPQIIVGQCGVDSHRRDPLTDLMLTVDGQRAAMIAMRDLADKYCDGKWLAVGGGGYGLIDVVPRAWTHLLAVASGRDLPVATPVGEKWCQEADLAAQSLDPMLRSSPVRSMGDEDGTGDYEPWEGAGGHSPVDAAIASVRSAVYPLHGLDPEDPRD
ncbi:acetoin utilization protein AcuC [Jongsikchunia kroppenstedtii]|uniref:acetoin utilization protein AcuC n=1 Tax=Jongsikchunia kroppenstedtii TaxID=1121721 RepID=UPI00036746AE|nr:acetoin utilization protein AcuC [Jongsikchunia kroppenstedtii]